MADSSSPEIKTNNLRSDKYFCECGAEFEEKKSLKDHVILCLKKDSVEVENTGDVKSRLVQCSENQLVYYCHVCEKNFFNETNLRYHIRRVHFNLKAKVPYFYRKKVNQIWFEKVMNSNKILEIRKASPNTLVLRRLSDNTAIKVNDLNTDILDVSNEYPTYSPAVFTTCDVCEKKVFKQSFLAHRKRHEKDK